MYAVYIRTYGCVSVHTPVYAVCTRAMAVYTWVNVVYVAARVRPVVNACVRVRYQVYTCVSKCERAYAYARMRTDLHKMER